MPTIFFFFFSFFFFFARLQSSELVWTPACLTSPIVSFYMIIVPLFPGVSLFCVMIFSSFMQNLAPRGHCCSPVCFVTVNRSEGRIIDMINWACGHNLVTPKCRKYYLVLFIYIYTCTFYVIKDYNKIIKHKTMFFLMPGPDSYLLLSLIIHYRKHYSILCISVRVILRKPFTLPLQKILNKFNCLHPPSEMTLCVLLHN